jgi:hypothetical protein
MPKSRSRRKPKPPTPIRAPRSGFSYRAGWRPRWHRTVGWLLILVGAAIIVVNDIAWVGVEVMPGGHSELYLLLGLLVAGFGSWWTGLFDRP